METSTKLPVNEKFDYVKLAGRTNNANYKEIASRLNDHKIIDLLHATIGMNTEAGEALDMLKKHIFYGKELDFANLLEETGDIFWYCALVCEVTGKSFEDIQVTNIKKLRKRFPNGFTELNAIERDLLAEREILEEGAK